MSSASRRPSRTPTSSSPRCSPTSWASRGVPCSPRSPQARPIRGGSRVKASPEAIRAALTGRPGPHHRFLLGLHLGQIDALAAATAAIDAEVERDLGPFREAVALLATIPGIGELTAEVVLSEIGLDMSRFPTAGHLVSWAGLCPR